MPRAGGGTGGGAASERAADEDPRGHEERTKENQLGQK